MEMNKEVTMYVLTQNQINQITSIADREAVNLFRAEQVKAEKTYARARNKVEKTKKLLKSYRRIKATLSEEAEFTEEEQVELRRKFLQDLMGNVKNPVSRSEINMKDTEKRKQKDLYCIYRIDKAMEMYRKECEQTGGAETKHRYWELSIMYLDGKVYTVQEISEIEQISDKTVYKDLGIACGIVTVYLLGI